MLIGPGQPRDRRARWRTSRSRAGVRVLGPQALRGRSRVSAGLDVGVIPFRAADPFVQGINPNKVYQYLAAGMPVVTTPILDLVPAPPRLSYAVDAGPDGGTPSRARSTLRATATRAARSRARTTGACSRSAWSHGIEQRVAAA